MEKVITGSLPDVFAKALRGLATAKLTKPGSFHTFDQTSCAVRCSYKVRSDLDQIPRFSYLFVPLAKMMVEPSSCVVRCSYKVRSDLDHTPQRSLSFCLAKLMF